MYETEAQFLTFVANTKPLGYNAHLNATFYCLKCYGLSRWSSG